MPRQTSSKLEGGFTVVASVVVVVLGAAVLVVVAKISQVSGSPGTQLAVDRLNTWSSLQVCGTGTCKMQV